jgi:small subunit ribosomal protein S1
MSNIETKEENNVEIATHKGDHEPENAFSAETDQTVEDTQAVDSNIEEGEESGELSFAELLAEQEAKTRRRVEPGQRLKGTVVLVTKEVAYVDIGMRSEAQLPLPATVKGEEVAVNDGDDLDVYVAKRNAGTVRLSMEPIMGHGDMSVIEAAQEADKPVEGVVRSAIRGGFEVNVAGVRCFCPISQIDLRSPQEPSEMVGQTYQFKVIEFEPSRKNVVLSRRSLLEETRRQAREEAYEQTFPGAIVTGRVVDVRDFGAFIDLGGGLTGMVHISELAHQKVAEVKDVLTIGDVTDVKVLDVTKDGRGKDRISLSLKALLPDPWDELNLQIGEVRQGKVVRHSRFGLFITLAPSIDGLLPMRYLKQSGRDLEEEMPEGSEIEVEVIDVNPHDHKVTLALPGWDEELKSSLKVGDSLEAEVIKVIPAGVLVQCQEDPARGLLPKRTLTGMSQKQISDHFQAGSVHRVTLEEIDDRGRYTFVIKNEDEVKSSDVERFSGSDEANLGHNPFASFFNQ